VELPTPPRTHTYSPSGNFDLAPIQIKLTQACTLKPSLCLQTETGRRQPVFLYLTLSVYYARRIVMLITMTSFNHQNHHKDNLSVPVARKIHSASTSTAHCSGRPKMEEKSSTTFSFSLSPDFLREKFPPFLYGKFQKKEHNTFLFLFLRVFSIFSEKSFLFSPPPWAGPTLPRF
jgi:hypothetical protein